MINYCGGRGSGKTVNLVNKANQAVKRGKKVLIITAYPGAGGLYKSCGLDKNIPVISCTEYMNSYNKYRDYELYLDEATYILNVLFRNKVKVVTTDLEDLVILNRKVWDENYD